MNDAILMINSSLGQHAAARVEGLEAKVKASMKAVIDGDWMGANDDGLFRAGIGGALLDIGKDSDDGRLLIRAVETLKQFSAFLNAAQAGLDVSLPQINETEPPLPLMKWWQEVRHGAILPE